MKRYKPIIAFIAMALLMLWPPVAAQAQTLKTATFEVKNKTVDTGKKIAIPFDDTKLTIEFDNNYTGDGSYFGVSKDTKASFSLGDGKRIKSVTLKGAPLVNKGISSVKSYFVFHESLTSTTTSKEYFYDSAIPSSGNYVETLSIKTATSLPYGSAKPLVIKFNSSLSAKSSLLKVGTIIVSYYDESELPKDNTLTYGLDYATPILYKNIGSGESEPAEWTTATGFAPFALDGATVLVRLGNTVTTFTASSTPKPATVIIDPLKRLIGATAGTSFFTQLYSAGIDDKLYRIEYLYNYKTLSYIDGYKNSSSNLNPPSTAINFATSGTIYYKSPNIAFGLQAPSNSALTDANATYTVKTNGLTDIFTGKSNAALNEGLQMCVAFDGIRVSYLSASEAPALPPMAPVVTMPSAAVLGADGVYKLLGSVELTPTISSSEVYEGASIVYSIDGSDFEPLLEGGKIMIDKSCVLQLKSVVSGSGESGIVSYFFDKLENIVNVDKASELEGLEAGTLVRLNCPLQILASGQFKTNINDFYILTHDSEYKSVPLVVRGSTDVPSNAYRPGASDGTNSNQDISHQNFLPAGGVVGTLEFENGRPVIVLKDGSQGIDNFSLCYNGNALKYNGTYDGKTVAPAGKNYVRFTYTHNRRTDITAEDFGSAINIDATYSASTGKFTLTNTGAYGQTGAPKELDVRQLSDANGFTTAVTSTYPTATNPTVDGEYTLCGLVGYDYDTKSYFLLPRFIGKALPELTIEPVDDSNATPTKFVKPDGTTPGKLYLEMTGKQFGLKLGGKNNSNQYYCVEVDKTSGAGFYKQATGDEATIDVTNVTIPADEPLKFLVYLNGEGASSAIDPNTKMLYSVRMYHLNVYNAVEGADVYTSIAQLLKDAKERRKEMNAYVRLTCPNMAIAVVRDNRSSNESDWNCMVVKDITSLINGEENADIPSLPLIFKNGIGMFSSSYFQYSNTTDKYYKNPRPGEYVKEMTFRVRIDENGNLTGDLTDFDQRYKSYAASAETQFGYNPELRPGEPWFKKYVGSITLMEDIIKADEAVFTADHLDKLVTIAGVKIAAQESVVRSGGIDALADEPAQKTYVAKMAKDVRLEWSIFPSTDEKTVDHTIIDNIGADATYTLTGLVRADADGGHFIEVLDLDPVFGKKLAVCGHEHHVTYYDQDIDDVKLSPEQIGTVVELTGMNLAGNDVDGFTTVTRQPVKLNFDNIASKTTGWNNQAKAAVEGNLPVKLMGTLIGAEDGSAYTLNVLTYDNLSSEAVDGNLALTFDGVTFDPEHTEFYSVGKLGYEAPDGVHVYYTMVDPAEMEFDESATDEQKAAEIAEKLAALPETLLDNAKGVVADRTVWVRLTTCTPGEAPIKAQVYEVTKRSTDVNTIAEVVKAQSADGKGVYHVRSPWLVTDKGVDRVIVTDGLIHAALHVSGQNASLPEVGSHLQEFAVAKGAAGMHPDYTYAFGLSGNDLHRVTVAAPATPVKAPEVENVASVSADSHGHLVGFTDVKLAGNKTAGFALKDALAADGGASTDLAVNNSLGISLDQMLDDDNEALYRIVGYAMPSAAGGMELWPAEVIRRTKIATVPVITLSAEKSLEPATVAISCADESVTIEYSTDGGKNWIEYTGAFSQSESAVIKARASKAYLDSSDEAAAAFTRLYISPAPLASFEESDGMTKVTLGSSVVGAPSGSYSIYYTLDGSIPTRESALYTAPIEVTSAGTVIKAILIDNDPEAVESAVKEWPVAFTPALSGDVTFEISQEAGKTVITISGPGTISYSFDGVTYVEYTDPIVITNDGQTDLQGTIRAFAQEDGKRPGTVKEESYRVSGIGSLSADGAAGVSVDGSTIVAPEGSMVFDITGRRVGLTGLRRGIYIVRLPDGKAVKVSVR